MAKRFNPVMKPASTARSSPRRGMLIIEPDKIPPRNFSIPTTSVRRLHLPTSAVIRQGRHHGSEHIPVFASRHGDVKLPSCECAAAPAGKTTCSQNDNADAEAVLVQVPRRGVPMILQQLRTAPPSRTPRTYVKGSSEGACCSRTARSRSMLVGTAA
jgi:hypothetical protein